VEKYMHGQDNSQKKGAGVLGIHHITAITKNAQRNIDFYSGFLGLRPVKITVNFDDPTSYHLYYGDYMGHPGTLLTFFVWPNIQKGNNGTGQVTAVAFLIPPNAIEYWTDRLRRNDISFVGPSTRFDGTEQFIAFRDPDGMMLELIAPSGTSSFLSSSIQSKDIQHHDDNDNNTISAINYDNVWKEGPINPDYAIRGFHSAAVTEEGYEHTATLLTDTMKFKLVAKDEREGRFRFKAIENRKLEAVPEAIGSVVDIVCQPDIGRGVVGIGSVHHIAWRASDDNHQLDLRKRIIRQANLNPTPVINRKYFHSVYFREPGGVLFEIATDPPGMTVDQRPEELGTKLTLPEWYEPIRSKIEHVLPPIDLPTNVREHPKGESAV
jgi:glyoxalase family protein